MKNMIVISLLFDEAHSVLRALAVANDNTDTDKTDVSKNTAVAERIMRVLDEDKIDMQNYQLMKKTMLDQAKDLSWDKIDGK